MRVLITGHNAYIGTILTPMVQAAGHEVVGMDNYLFEKFDGTRPLAALLAGRLEKLRP